MQLGPTLLDLLGLDYTQLTGVQVEGTKPLPGLPKGRQLPPASSPLVTHHLLSASMSSQHTLTKIQSRNV